MKKSLLLLFLLPGCFAGPKPPDELPDGKYKLIMTSDGGTCNFTGNTFVFSSINITITTFNGTKLINGHTTERNTNGEYVYETENDVNGTIDGTVICASNFLIATDLTGTAIYTCPLNGGCTESYSFFGEGQ